MKDPVEIKTLRSGVSGLDEVLGGGISDGRHHHGHAELVDSYTELRLSPHGISFLTDGLILRRYVQIDGEIRRIMAVAKMRGLDHDKRMRLYDVGPEGIVPRRTVGREAPLGHAPPLGQSS